MEKGFTLIEMIAVVMIIAMISLIGIPKIVNQIGEKNKEISDVTEKIIFDAAELYFSDRPMEYKKDVGDRYCVQLEELINNGLLVSPVKDYKTGQEIPLTKYVSTRVNVYNEFSNYEITDDKC